MYLEIAHTSSYQYSSPVYPEPQHFFFHPQHRSYFQVADFKLDVNPSPTGIAERLNVENNVFHQCWFNETLGGFDISARIRVSIDPFNAFDFLVEETAKTSYNKTFDAYLLNDAQLSENLKVWVNDIKEESNDPVTLFGSFCSAIHDNWDHQARYENSLLTPDECFEQKKGSCRDLSWMLIQALRYLGIPARFVSGYSYNPELGEGHELHAWVEAWINGAGWIGLDPSSGLFTTEYYIPTATSYHPANTLPVQGSYRGEAASSLHTSVEITVEK